MSNWLIALIVVLAVIVFFVGLAALGIWLHDLLALRQVRKWPPGERAVFDLRDFDQ